MTRRTLSLVLSVLALTPLVLVVVQRDAAAQSQDPPRAREGGEGRPQRGEGRPDRRREGPDVEGSMKAMDKALDQLEAALKDSSKRSDCLKLLGEAQRGLGGAKAAPTPKKVLDLGKNANDKAKVEDTYRRNLLASTRLLLDIEQAVLDQKGDEGFGKLNELFALRDRVHKELGIED